MKLTFNRLSSIILSSALTSCANVSLSQNKHEEKTMAAAQEKIMAAARAVDDIAKLHEEFGTATLSSLLISMPTDKNGLFDLERKSETYFTEAKTSVQGGIAQAISDANVFAVTLKGQYNPMVEKQYQAAQAQYSRDQTITDAYNKKLQEYCDVLKSDWINETDDAKKATKQGSYKSCLDDLKPVETPTAPQLSTNLPALPTDALKPADEAKNILKDSGLITAVGGLLSSLQPTISNGDAISIAAGDKAREVIYRIIGNPDQAKHFKDKLVLLAASTVAVNPGWRTKEDYTAKIEAQLALKFFPARGDVTTRFINSPEISEELKEALAKGIDKKISIPSDYACDEFCNDFDSKQIPLSVVAVSPLTDSQTLDLSNSKRRAIEISLMLAGALKELNAEAQAQMFEQWARIEQKDSKTRSANVTINSYSINGNQFGYQVFPRYQGLDVGSGEDESANILGPQSFPVLLLIAIDRDSLNPRIKASKFGDEHYKYTLVEPNIEMTQTYDWTALSKNWFDRLFGTEWFSQGVYASNYLESALNIRNKFDAVNECKECEKYYREINLLSLKKVVQTLPVASYGSQEVPLEILFPEPPAEKKVPNIDSVLPSKVVLKRQAGNVSPERINIVILGQNLGMIDSSKIEVDGDVTASLVPGELPDTQLKLSVVVSGNSPISFRIPVFKDNGKLDYILHTPPIKVEVVDVAAAK